MQLLDRLKPQDADDSGADADCEVCDVRNAEMEKVLQEWDAQGTAKAADASIPTTSQAARIL